MPVIQIDTIRSLVRPVVTGLLTLTVVYLAVTGKVTAKDVLLLYGPIIGFWFGNRSQEGSKPGVAP